MTVSCRIAALTGPAAALEAGRGTTNGGWPTRNGGELGGWKECAWRIDLWVHAMLSTSASLERIVEDERTALDGSWVDNLSVRLADILK